VDHRRALDREAQLISEFLWRTVSAELRRNPALPEALRRMGSLDRMTYSVAAGRRPASRDCWDLVVEQVEGRQKAARAR